MSGLNHILRFRSFTHRPCLTFVLVFALGIVLGRYGIVHWFGWASLMFVFMLAGMRGSKIRISCLYAALLCLGALLYQNNYLFSEDHVAQLKETQALKVTALRGVIDSDVFVKQTGFAGTKQVFEMELDAIRINQQWHNVRGRVLVHFFPQEKLSYAQHIILEGKLYKPYTGTEGRFSYRQYLEEQGIFYHASVASKSSFSVLSQKPAHVIKAYAYQLKHRCQEVFKTYLTPLESGVIQAMIVGDRSMMDKGIYTLFQKTGTAHILAISGMNMAIISVMILFFLRIFISSRRWQLALTAVFLLFYALLSGWSPSVVRAVFMAAVLLASYFFEDEADGLNSLGLAALMLMVICPGSLFDIGFQLSVVCVGALLGFYPVVFGFVEGKIKPYGVKLILQAGMVSLIAWGASLPIIAYRFEMMTPVAVLANIPVVVLADVTVALGLVLVIAAQISPWLAMAVAGALKLVFHVMAVVTQFFAVIPLGNLPIRGVQFFHVFCYYSFLIIVYLVVKNNSCHHSIYQRKIL